jgi:Carboxypeptidase regulatory-like domain
MERVKRLILVALLLGTGLPMAADECPMPRNPVKVNLACGKVYDPRGKVLSGVDLELMNKEAVAGEARADSEGKFSFGQLPVGKYTLTTHSSGWQLAWPVEITAAVAADASENGASHKGCKDPLKVKLSIGLSACGSSVDKKGYKPRFDRF